MTFPIAPYRSSHLCALHAAAPPACPRCATDWPAPSEPTGPPRTARRVFVAGLFAATAFGAVIGTAIGFVAGTSPLWGVIAPAHAAGPLREPRRLARPPANRERPAPPSIAAPLAGAGPTAPVDPPVAALTPILARLGGGTDDPEILLARLRALSKSGVPIAIETRRLWPATRDALVAEISQPRPMRVLPVGRGGRIVGVKILGVRRDGALYQAGARSGDVVLAINGIEMGGPPEPLAVPPFGDSRALVVELERAGEHRVLVLRW
ncbi:MAG: hypothetical protein HYY06_30025 [Deltaproteobacteria bacterium]|nr:hypothetical protein [Deltaproteobacteria bacterium]